MIQFFVGISDVALLHCLQGNILPKREDRTDQKVRSLSKKMAAPSSRKRKDKPVNRSYTPLKALLLTSLFASVYSQLTEPFPALFELSSLNGSNGFILYGETDDDRCGQTVSAGGDVNGDGINDLVIGCSNADPIGRMNAGMCYIVFGTRESFTSNRFNLSSLNGSNGFIINGEVKDDNFGYSVSSDGDVNGDGIDDIAVGAWIADANGVYNSGKIYVIFGSQKIGLGGSLELSTLDGTNGFTIHGEATGDGAGVSVSLAGDVNGDGLSDIVIGANSGDPPGRSQAGKSYVVFGSRVLLKGGVIDLTDLNGINGFSFLGEAVEDISGGSVSSAGDINGDGLSDIIIGAQYADPPGRPLAGKSYVYYGNRSTIVGGTFELHSLNGSNGFVINGNASKDYSGSRVSLTGDLDGDGFSDLIIGANHADPFGKNKAGSNYVIFGNHSVGSSGLLELSALNGVNGFTINGEVNGDVSGTSLSLGGDVNGDGIADLAIGAAFANRAGRNFSGMSYVIFGKSNRDFGAVLELSSLNGKDGFKINGEETKDFCGMSISTAGDVNGDRISDVVIGAWSYYNAPLGKSAPGKVFVIYGRNLTQSTLNRSPTHTISFNPIQKSTPLLSSLTYQGNTNSFRSISSLSVSLARTSSTGQLLSPENDQTGMLVGIVVTIFIIACSVFSGGAYYYRRLRMKKNFDDSSQENNGAKLNSVSPDSHAANTDQIYDLLPTGDSENHYSEWPAEQKPHDASHYISMDKIEKAHDNYVDAKMQKAQMHYSEIRN